ncbi:cytochrome P450 [Penicillium angulare]|uniref:Cytochrome P450 n=1 Tax=Penicillium angulare TaxID=116970 RepID=A0A9W9ETA4_9EURO|nr:cytochrome P450 [Penicillium angulare]
MITFIEFWLSTLTLTSGGIIYQSITGGEYTKLHFKGLAAHLVAFVAYAVYWMILYPRYFTPLGNIPTPKVHTAFPHHETLSNTDKKRRILTGNYPVLFPDNVWVPLRELAENTPNDGLLRIYSALSGEALLVTSPAAIRDMLAVNCFDFAHQDLVKISIKRFTGSNLGFLSNDDYKACKLYGCHVHRKHMLPAFTIPHIRTLTGIFWDKAHEMVGCMSRDFRADPSARVNFREYVSRATLDNIGMAGMGHDFQTLKQPNNDLRSHYRKLILDPSRIFNWVGLLSRYIDMRLLMKAPIKELIEISRSADYLRAVTGKLVHERSEKLAESEEHRAKDIITVALESGVFRESELVDHVMTFLTAGHESTATAFEWTMYELGRRHEMQTRLRDEIREAIGTDLTASDVGLRVQSIPYLNAFCNEVLRCYPFSPIIVRVAKQESVIMGQRIPKGTVVLYSAEVSNHDKTLWGPDADIFDPERWMSEGNAKSGGASSNYAMLTFGAGPRNCIGANFARATLECLVAAVLSTFEFELVNPETAGALKFGQTKKPAEGVYGKLKLI